MTNIGSTLAPEPEPNEHDADMIAAMAGVLIGLTGVQPEVALGLSRALADNGFKVDMAEQTVDAWWSTVVARLVEEGVETLDEDAIAEAANYERYHRLQDLAAQSRKMLVPDPEIHRQINILLDEIGA